VLGQIERLNATVTGALRVARSGTIRSSAFGIMVPAFAAFLWFVLQLRWRLLADEAGGRGLTNWLGEA